MGKVEITESGIRRATRDWRRLGRLMQDTGRDFAGLTVEVLPSSVQTAGATFTQEWEAFADRGRLDADAFVVGLEETLRDFLISEENTKRRLKDLETSMPSGSSLPSSDRLLDRLGPQS